MLTVRPSGEPRKVRKVREAREIKIEGPYVSIMSAEQRFTFGVAIREVKGCRFLAIEIRDREHGVWADRFIYEGAIGGYPFVDRLDALYNIILDVLVLRCDGSVAINELDSKLVVEMERGTGQSKIAFAVEFMRLG